MIIWIIVWLLISVVLYILSGEWVSMHHYSLGVFEVNSHQLPFIICLLSGLIFIVIIKGIVFLLLGLFNF